MMIPYIVYMEGHEPQIIQSHNPWVAVKIYIRKQDRVELDTIKMVVYCDLNDFKMGKYFVKMTTTITDVSEENNPVTDKQKETAPVENKSSPTKPEKSCLNCIYYKEFIKDNNVMHCEFTNIYYQDTLVYDCKYYDTGE